jgi:CCR4-NOT transcription complex subunit 3
LRQQEAVRQQQAQAEALKQQQAEALRQQQEATAKQQQQQQQQAQQQAQEQAQQQAQLQQQVQQQQQNQLQTQLQQPEQSSAKLSISLPTQPSQNNPIDILTSGLGSLGLGVLGEKRTESTAPISTETGLSFLSALNDSFSLAPKTVENERSRNYTPQNPYPTPASYPSTPSTLFDNPAIFEKLGTDCLFFIFYYAQGTYQQYLAARELKKQSWRFHKKYMTWFQRHEEPKITTDEYEQGTYVYFDYETGWCTRIKTDFRFEYSFLEDSLQ